MMGEGGGGITLVNIGVGPSNAKTICDHIAVLRPEVWLMIGHCGGLRPSQAIGDYVLAHAYLRDDHLLDDVLPVEIPLPAIAEVQRALFEAAMSVTGEDEDSLKKGSAPARCPHRRRNGRYSTLFGCASTKRRLASQGSATVAAQGYRFRVPYDPLCVSDKPLHGELSAGACKMPFTTVDQPAFAHWHRFAIAAHARGDALHSRNAQFREPPSR